MVSFMLSVLVSVGCVLFLYKRYVESKLKELERNIELIKCNNEVRGKLMASFCNTINLRVDEMEKKVDSKLKNKKPKGE